METPAQALRRAAAITDELQSVTDTAKRAHMIGEVRRVCEDVLEAIDAKADPIATAMILLWLRRSGGVA